MDPSHGGASASVAVEDEARQLSLVNTRRGQICRLFLTHMSCEDKGSKYRLGVGGSRDAVSCKSRLLLLTHP